MALKDLPSLRPQPYRQALPDEQHLPKQGSITVDQGRPILQIQIKSGSREVFHTPDTTVTPTPTHLEDLFQLTINQPPIKPVYQQSQQPQ